MNISFYVDENDRDLMCKLENELYKIAEIYDGIHMEFETLDGLKEVFGNDCPLTEDILDKGMEFAEEQGYRVHY